MNNYTEIIEQNLRGEMRETERRVSDWHTKDDRWEMRDESESTWPSES